MFAREIEHRQRKFEKDAIDRRRDEKEKIAKATKERLAARQRREEIERKAKERQLLKEQQKQQEELRKEELREINRGVFLEASLSPLPLSEAVAASYGIRKWMDKVVLPASMSDELMRQEAFKNGALLFELVAENGKRTHVGVFKFSAQEGTIQIPQHVVHCLWGENGMSEGRVRVSYKRLVDGTFARLQPLNQGFHEAVGENMKDVLEAALSQYTALTEGDIIQIETTGTMHHLKVVELSPSSAVRILQTDLEVDVLPSAEVEEALKRKMEPSDRISFGRPNRLQKYRIAKQADAQSKEDSNLGFVCKEQPSERSKVTRGIEMEPEVSEDAEDVIVCSVRFPDGSSANRRFRLDDSVSDLFRFVSLTNSDRLGDGYKLVTQFPSMDLTDDRHSSLKLANTQARLNSFYN